jgi:hypothetical protein
MAHLIHIKTNIKTVDIFYTVSLLFFAKYIFQGEQFGVIFDFDILFNIAGRA